MMWSWKFECKSEATIREHWWHTGVHDRVSVEMHIPDSNEVKMYVDLKMVKLEVATW